MSTLPPLHSPQSGSFEATTRVDTAHGALPTRELHAAHGDAVADPPSLNLLRAIAGHDPLLASQQLRGQALELATMLRDKQRLLDQRESELNARAALLESDLRAARLRHYRDEPEPTRPAPMVPADGRQSPSETDIPRHSMAAPEPAATDPERMRILNDPAEPSYERHGEQPSASLDTDEPPAGDSDQTTTATLPTQRPTLLAATELGAQLEEVDQQRHELRLREEKLDLRQRHVAQMHDEVTQLHREALELRLASEQVWADLKSEFPQEELSRALATIRAKLADNYRLANDMLAQRKDELHQLRADLNLQEQRLRQQRRDLQMWADRRYDEIESRLAKIIVRERELDQLESQLQRQSLQWQTQRQAYRQEIEQLSWQLHERSAC